MIADLALDGTRDLVLTGGAPVLMTAGERIAQAVGIRLRAWRGEWFLDAGYGVPYLDSVFGKARRPEIIESVIRAEILGVAGVRRLTSFRLTIDPRARVMTVEFAADTRDGGVSGSVSI